MASTSISCRVRRKEGSDIMALAPFQETSLMPRITTTHSQTACTGFGGVANDLGNKPPYTHHHTLIDNHTLTTTHSQTTTHLPPHTQRLPHTQTACTGFGGVANDLGSKPPHTHHHTLIRQPHTYTHRPPHTHRRPALASAAWRTVLMVLDPGQ